jgi:hypothetical protein
MREDRAVSATLTLEGVMARNNLEDTIMRNAHSELLQRTTEQRNERAQRMRSMHTALVSRAKEERDFSFGFISQSHHISLLTEKTRSDTAKRTERAALAESAEKAKRESTESRATLRKAVADVKSQKLNDAGFARFLLDQKRERMKKIGEARRSEIGQRHGIDRERAKTAMSKSRESRYQKPADLLIPVVDEIETASQALEMAIGRDLGDLESHMVSGFISGILST